MKQVDKKDLNILELFNFGSFSHVFEAYLGDNLYCFKQFRKPYPDDITENICAMTEEVYSNEFAPPIYIVKENGEIVGYLSDLKQNTVELDDIVYTQKKIILLKKAKEVLLKLHNEYNRIHGDLNHANFIYNEAEQKAFLIDFDSSLRTDQEVKSTISFPKYLLEYLKYYPFDFLVDVYEFNLQTLALLTKKNYLQLLKEISEGKYPLEEKLKDKKDLCRELVLDNTRKKISGEFIIDYL